MDCPGYGYISKTSKCLIFLNFLKKKKGAKCNNFQRNKKKNFKEILVLKILRLLIALKHSFKGFKGQKALFKPFDVFLMYGIYNSSCHFICLSPLFLQQVLLMPLD